MKRDNEIIIYQDEEEIISVSVLFAYEDLWLTQEQLASLYATTQQNVSHWSRSQSECVYLSLLTGEKQDDLAKRLDTQRQNVSKKLKAAKEQLC